MRKQYRAWDVDLMFGRNCDCLEEEKKLSLRTGFEPVRVAPNGFQVHLLNRSDTAAIKTSVYFI